MALAASTPPMLLCGIKRANHRVIEKEHREEKRQKERKGRTCVFLALFPFILCVLCDSVVSSFSTHGAEVAENGGGTVGIGNGIERSVADEFIAEHRHHEALEA